MRFFCYLLLILFGAGAALAQGRPSYDPSPVILNLQIDDTHDERSPCFDVADPKQCIWNEIDGHLNAMREYGAGDDIGIDIYVPGTTQEDGNPKQFKAILDHKPVNRIALSVKYQPADDWDAIDYKDGVLDASYALRTLLHAIKEDGNLEDVRVFGHSKGAHAVAVVANDPSADYNYAKFFAFGQPGRTNKDLGDDAPPAPLGTPGYIEKLSDNLVGITWENDEVQFYRKGGILAPEAFQIPGLINPAALTGEQKAGGTLTKKSRIDHHNTYGGDYTQTTFPYCAAGSRYSWARDDNCTEREVQFKPYFWGNTDCYTEAMSMMSMVGNVGKQRYIGGSEPREKCVFEDDVDFRHIFFKDDNFIKDDIFIKEAIVEYHFNIPDQDCKVNATFEFLPRGSKIEWDHGKGTRLSVTKLSDMKGFRTKSTKDVKKTQDGFWVPNRFRLKVRTEIIKKSGNRNCFKPAAAQLKIKSLKLIFDHPDTDKTDIEKYLIRGSSKSGWKRKETGRDHDDMDIFKSGNAIKFSSAARAGKHGVFYKNFNLVDREIGNIPIDLAVVDYKFHIPNNDCKVQATFEFLPGQSPLSWEHGGGPKLWVTKLVDMDNYDHKEKKGFYVPNHIRLKVRTHIIDKAGGGSCDSLLPVQMHIKNLRFEFRHPGTNEKHIQYLIRGQFEGDGLVGKITGQNNVAWQKQGIDDDDDMDMFNTHGSIKISSMAKAGKKGVFYKDLYLID